MTLHGESEEITYDQFREQWLEDIEEVGLSPLEKGRRFGVKLITQWLEVTTDDDDFFVCDGPGDGGIDIAYLKRSESPTDGSDDGTEEGDTWYIVQSKYGTSFSGYGTISMEGHKLLNTLQGNNHSISADSQSLLEKISIFREQSSPTDRIILVFATTDPIGENDRIALEAIKRDGREELFENFDVEDVSLRTIWERVGPDSEGFLISVYGDFATQGHGLVVGTVSLINLFDFLKTYQGKTGNLDQLYEKNVRQFLGSRRKINKGIRDTLEKTPEKFGLYNNGITLVVKDYTGPTNDGLIQMTDPYIVNGCQTTRTIWHVLDSKFNSGGTGCSSTNEDWKDKASLGGVVTKIVRSDEAEIHNITRFTNLQNSVRDQDFVALDSGYRNWAREMEENHCLYLEIQNGGIESRKAYEKQHPEKGHFKDYVKVLDLIKIYGAGWLSLPGTAFRANAPFLPRGIAFEKLTSLQELGHTFGHEDLYAAYKIKCTADAIGFGRNSSIASRRLSRFLFYHVIINILSRVILTSPELEQQVPSPSAITDVVAKLSEWEGGEQLGVLGKVAVGLIDEYLTIGNQRSAYNEESFSAQHNSNLNAFLKADGLGKESHTPLLEAALAIHSTAFSQTGGREKVASVLVAS